MQLVSTSVPRLAAGIVILTCIDPLRAYASSMNAVGDKPAAAIGSEQPTSGREHRPALDHTGSAARSAAQPTALGGLPYENVVWNGRRHRNVCIHITNGEAIVRLRASDAPPDGPNGFEVYANTCYDSTSRPVLAGRAIEIKTPSYPSYNGRICLGIAPNPPNPTTRESTR